MTTETATPTGVEAEPQVEPTPNPRDAMIEALAERVSHDRVEELKAGGEVIEPETPATPEVAAEPGAPAEPAAEITPAASAEPEPELITVKVDGELRQVHKDKIYEAGLRAVQKESTADKRLEEATRLLKEAEQRYNQTQPKQEPNPSPQPEWDDSIIAYALEHGNEEEKTEAIRQLRGRDKQAATPDQIAAFATAKVLDLIDRQDSGQWFGENYKDVVSDPYLFELAKLKEAQMRQSGDQRPRKELYKAIGDDLMKWKGGTVATQTLEQKREQKATITNLPSASVRKAAPEAPKAQTPSDIIEEMRKQRGQAA